MRQISKQKVHCQSYGEEMDEQMQLETIFTRLQATSAEIIELKFTV